MFDQIHEECGIFGIFSQNKQDVASTTYYALFALQHRGQESAGIVVNDDGVFHAYKDVGLVSQVFDQSTLSKLGEGNIAVGHVRYATTGTCGRENAQPLVVNHLKGNIAIAHNGNLVNSAELRDLLEGEGSIFHTTSDTEVISYMIIKERIKTDSIEEAVLSAMDKLEGAYSLVIMSPSKLIAARDRHGFRPLCYGQKEDGTYVVASESCALDAVGAKKIREVNPGEVIVFSNYGIKSYSSKQKAKKTFCVFEYLYFARPDSEIDGFYVHEARKKAGRFLAENNRIIADVVIGVPDSGLDAAIGFSEASGIPYEIGFIKNKYVGRTFIAPNQKHREDLVRMKLNVIQSVVKDKRVVLVDDSIVRGTTSARIVKLLRDAGAKEVHMLSAAPAFLNPCYYGTDIDSRDHLIAVHHTVEETAKIIGVDSLGYLTIEQAKQLAGNNPEEFCVACFDGNYPTYEPIQTAKNRFECKISENKNN